MRSHIIIHYIKIAPNSTGIWAYILVMDLRYLTQVRIPPWNHMQVRVTSRVIPCPNYDPITPVKVFFTNVILVVPSVLFPPDLQTPSIVRLLNASAKRLLWEIDSLYCVLPMKFLKTYSKQQKYQEKYLHTKSKNLIFPNFFTPTYVKISLGFLH